ncbi:MAG: hypothetical protein R3246_13280 [Acidimicrobiia bacterium]|nr:hypothetical protein [Acidimicrobiia bacterium]
MPGVSTPARGRRRRIAILGVISVVLLMLPAGTGSAATGGPVVLMGIDAEDGGVGGHGPIGVYIDVVNSVLGQVSNGGSGILVIGGGKSASDDVTEFWDAIGGGTSQTITYVNGDVAIGGQSLAGFAMIAIVSSEGETSDGGLTEAESAALNARAGEIAAFVNNGGGLFGTSQAELSAPYGYLGDIGAFTFTVDISYRDITPTAEGTAVGITDAMDVCCWHDYYDTFPSFLDVLATDADNDRVAALGGVDVVIPDDSTPPPPPQPKGTIVVSKVAPDADGDVFVFFIGTDRFVLSHGESASFSVNAGPQQIQEHTTEAWEVVDVQCSPSEVATVSVDGQTGTAIVDLPADATVTCTFTNAPVEDAGEEDEVLGTTVTTSPGTPDEVVSDTLPFTGPTGGGMVPMALAGILAGGLVLFLARGRERDATTAAPDGGWSSM